MSLTRDAAKPTTDANPATGPGVDLNKEVLPGLDRRHQRAEARHDVEVKKEETERRDNLVKVLMDSGELTGITSVLTKAKPTVTSDEDRRRKIDQDQQDASSLYFSSKKKKQQVSGVADHIQTILLQLGFDPPTSAKLAEAVSKESSVRVDGASAREVAERVARSLFNALDRDDTLARLGIQTSNDPDKAEQENAEAIARFAGLLEVMVEKEFSKQAEEEARRAKEREKAEKEKAEKEKREKEDKDREAEEEEEREEELEAEVENDDTTFFVSANLSSSVDNDADDGSDVDTVLESDDPDEDEREAERVAETFVDRQAARLEEVLRATYELEPQKIQRILAAYRTLCESRIDPSTVERRAAAFSHVLVEELGATTVLDLFGVTGADLADRIEATHAAELVTAVILPTLRESEVVALRRNPQPGADLRYSETDVTLLRTQIVVRVLSRVPGTILTDIAAPATVGTTTTVTPAVVEVLPPPRPVRSAAEIRAADEAWMTTAVTTFREDTQAELRTALDRALRDGTPVQVAYDEVIVRRQRAYETFLASAEVRDIAGRNAELVRTRSDFATVRAETVSILTERLDSERRAAEERARVELHGVTVDPAAAAALLADRELGPVLQRLTDIGQGKLPGNSLDQLRDYRAELERQGKGELFLRAIAAYQTVHGRPLLADFTSRVVQRADTIDATITRFLEVAIPAERRAEHRRQFIEFKVREYTTICAHIEARLEAVQSDNRDIMARRDENRAEQRRRAIELSDLMRRVLGRDGMTDDQRTALRDLTPGDGTWEWKFSDATRDMFALADDLIGRQGADALATRHPTGGPEIVTLRAAIRTAVPGTAFPFAANDIHTRERNYWNTALDRVQVELGQLYGADLVAHGYIEAAPRPIPITVDVPHAVYSRQYVYDYRVRFRNTFWEAQEAARDRVRTAREVRGCDADGGIAGNAASAWATIDFIARRELLRENRTDLDFLIAQHRGRFARNLPTQASIDALNNFEVDNAVAVIRRIANGQVVGDPPQLLEQLRTRVGASVYDRAQAAYRAGGADPVLLAIYREAPGCRRLFETLAGLDSNQRRLEYLRQIRTQVGEANFALIVDAYDRHMGAPLAAHLVQWSGSTVDEQRTCLTQLFAADARLFTAVQRTRFIEYTRAEQALILATIDLERDRAGAAIAPAEAALYRSREHLAELVQAWSTTETDPARRATYAEIVRQITLSANEADVDRQLLAALHLRYPELAGNNDLAQCCSYLEVVAGARAEGNEPTTEARVHELLRERGFDIAGAHLYPTDRPNPAAISREDCARISGLLRGRVNVTQRLAEVRRTAGNDQSNEATLAAQRFNAVYSDLFPEYSAQRFTDARRQATDYLRNLDLRIQAEAARGTPDSAEALAALSAERDYIDWRTTTVRMEVLLSSPNANPDRIRALLGSFLSVYSGPMERGEIYVQQVGQLNRFFNAVDAFNARSLQLAARALQSANERVTYTERQEDSTRASRDEEQRRVDGYGNVFSRNNPFGDYDKHVRERDRLSRLLTSRETDVASARGSVAAVTAFQNNDIPASRRALYSGILQRPGAAAPPGSLTTGGTLRGLQMDLWGGESRDYSAQRDAVTRELDAARAARTTFVVGAPSDFTRRAGTVGVAVPLSDGTRTATGCATQQDLVARVTGILVTDLAQNPSAEAMAALRASVPAGTPLAIHLEALKDLPPRDQLERLLPRLRTTPDDILRVQLFLHSFGRPDLMPVAGGATAPMTSADLWRVIAAKDMEEVALLLEVLPGMRKLQEVERLTAALTDDEMRGLLEVFRAQNNDTSLGARLLALRPIRDVGATYVVCLSSSRLVTNADIAPLFNGPVPVTRDQRTATLRASLTTDPTVADLDLKPIRDWLTANLNDRAALMASLELARAEQRTDDVRRLTTQLTDLNRRMDEVIDTTFRNSRFTSDQIERSGIRRAVVQMVDSETQTRVAEMASPTGEMGRDAARAVTLLERGGGGADIVIDNFRSRNYSPAQIELFNALYSRAAAIPHVAAGTVRLAGDIRADLLRAIPADDPRRVALGILLTGGRDAVLNMDMALLSEAIRLSNPTMALQAMISLRNSGQLDNALALLRSRSPDLHTAYEALRLTPQWREVQEYREAIRTLNTNAQAATILAVIELRNEAYRLRGDADRLTAHMVGVLSRSDAATVARLTAEYSRIYGRELAADLSEFTRDVRGLGREVWTGLLSTEEAQRIAAIGKVAAFALRVGWEDHLKPEINFALLHATRALARTATEAQAVLRHVEGLINEALGPETPRRTLLEYTRHRNPRFGDSDAALVGRIFGPTPVGLADLEAYTQAREQYVVLMTQLADLRHRRNGTHSEALAFHTFISNHRSRSIIDMGNVGPISEAFGGREVYRAQVINNNAMYQNQLILLAHQRVGLGDIDNVVELIRLRGVAHLRDIAEGRDGGLSADQSTATISELNTRDQARRWVDADRRAVARWQREFRLNQVDIEHYEFNLSLGYTALKVIVITGVSFIPFVGVAGAFALATAWNAADKAYRMVYNGLSFRDATRMFLVELAFDAAFCGLGALRLVRGVAKTGQGAQTAMKQTTWSLGVDIFRRPIRETIHNVIELIKGIKLPWISSRNAVNTGTGLANKAAAAGDPIKWFSMNGRAFHAPTAGLGGALGFPVRPTPIQQPTLPKQNPANPPDPNLAGGVPGRNRPPVGGDPQVNLAPPPRVVAQPPAGPAVVPAVPVGPPVVPQVMPPPPQPQNGTPPNQPAPAGQPVQAAPAQPPGGGTPPGQPPAPGVGPAAPANFDPLTGGPGAPAGGQGAAPAVAAGPSPNGPNPLQGLWDGFIGGLRRLLGGGDPPANAGGGNGGVNPAVINPGVAPTALADPAKTTMGGAGTQTVNDGINSYTIAVAREKALAEAAAHLVVNPTGGRPPGGMGDHTSTPVGMENRIRVPDHKVKVEARREELVLAAVARIANDNINQLSFANATGRQNAFGNAFQNQQSLANGQQQSIGVANGLTRANSSSMSQANAYGQGTSVANSFGLQSAVQTANAMYSPQAVALTLHLQNSHRQSQSNAYGQSNMLGARVSTPYGMSNATSTPLGQAVSSANSTANFFASANSSQSMSYGSSSSLTQGSTVPSSLTRADSSFARSQERVKEQEVTTVAFRQPSAERTAATEAKRQEVEVAAKKETAAKEATEHRVKSDVQHREQVEKERVASARLTPEQRFDAMLAKESNKSSGVSATKRTSYGEPAQSRSSAKEDLFSYGESKTPSQQAQAVRARAASVAAAEVKAAEKVVEQETRRAVEQSRRVQEAAVVARTAEVAAKKAAEIAQNEVKRIEAEVAAQEAARAGDRFDFVVGTSFGHSFGHKLPDQSVAEQDENRFIKARQAKKLEKEKRSAEQARMRDMIMRQLLTQQLPDAMKERLLRMLAELGLSEVEYRQLESQLGQQSARALVEEVAQQPLAMTVDGQKVAPGQETNEATATPEKPVEAVKRPNRTRADLYRKLKEKDTLKSSSSLTKRGNYEN